MDPNDDAMGLQEVYSSYLNTQSNQQDYFQVSKEIMDRVEDEHFVAYEQGRLEVFQRMLDEKLDDRFRVHSNRGDGDSQQKHPAVDLASGVGTHPIEYAKQFQREGTLEWYPTESSSFFLDTTSTSSSSEEQNNNKQRRPLPQGKSRLDWLQQALQFFIESRNDGPVLGKDRDGQALYKGDAISLVGLSRQGYNNRRGKVICPDDRDPVHRVGVQLDTRNRNSMMSLKFENLVRHDEGMEYEEALQLDEDRATLQELLDRSCDIHVEKQETWENLRPVHGRCAVVTSTCLKAITATTATVTSEQPRQDDDSGLLPYHYKLNWRKVLELSTLLLAPGGLLLQYGLDEDDFGDEQVMKDHAARLSLRLEFLERTEPIDYSGHGRMFLLLWKKTQIEQPT
jgi:hypothetical protein